MKRMIYCLLCLAALPALQGCFWHSSHTEVVREVPVDQSSSTTVTTPQAQTTVTTNP